MCTFFFLDPWCWCSKISEQVCSRPRKSVILRKARAGSRCEPGWASRTGRTDATCSKCAANHYSSRNWAKCLIQCPGGYVASAGSDSSHHCTPINPAAEVHDTSSYF